jgi:RHS repeat-associated protein
MNRIAGLRCSVVLLGVLAGTVAQAQDLAGRTVGMASVTPAGAARYAIPLSLPPGTNGLAPGLAITYDSRSGNGLLGVGFRLSGLSVIERCNATLAQDGRAAVVALDASDRLCVDGQRLRLTAGVYGAAGSQYQTEVESFARVTAIGAAGSGPASFRVERRDGLVYEYGATLDSRLESAGSSTPHRWAVSRIRDRDGNYVDFQYVEDASTGSHRPSRIDYTGNLQTGAATYYSVRFAYETRPVDETPSAYRAGGVLSEPLRLDRIEVVHVATGRPVRSFDLEYATPGSTGRSRLASVRECADSACLPPTQFEWTSVYPGWSVNMSVALSTEQYAGAVPGDIDGDGFDDLAYYDGALRSWSVLRGSPYGFQSSSVGTGLGSDSDPAQAISADLDGNGTRDILVPGSGSALHWLRRTPAGPYAYTTTGVINPAPPGGLIAADIDGDGRDDLVYVKAAGTAIYWRRNQTVSNSSYAAEAILWSVPAGTRLPAAPFVETQQRFRSIVRSGDVNGDGRIDLTVLTQQGTCGATATCATWVNRWQVLASTGTALVPQFAFDGSTEALLADFNADGLTDIAYGAPGSAWQLLFGTGSRGAVLAGFAGPFASAAVVPAGGGRTLVIDWDADGRTDLLQPTPSGEFQHCRSVGTSLAACQPAGVTASTTITAPMTLDVNGDAYPDLAFAATGVRLLLHHQVPPDHLVAATDGFGARSDFQYAALSSSAVHQAGTASSFPVRDHVRPGWVVSRITRADSAGSRQATYLYEGAKTHLHGRGFLGFARRTATETNGYLVTVEEYLQDPAAFERIGVPARVTIQQRSGLPVSRTTYTWAQHSYGSGFEARRFPYAAKTEVERFELDGVRVATTSIDSSYDLFGTLLRRDEVAVEQAKGLNPWAQHVSSTVLTGVVNDTSNWCLGRPATTQSTRRHSLPGGEPITRTLAHTWDYARCRLTQQVVEPSSASQRVTTDIGYDSHGNPATVDVTPVGLPARTTRQTWTDNGRFAAARTNPEGHTATVAWDEVRAQPTRVTDANGLVTVLQHDPFGRLERETRPDGTSTAITRSTCGAGCPWPGTRHVVATSERSASDAVTASSETGFDAHAREVYSRLDQPGGGQAFQAKRYDLRGQLAQESVPGPCCATPARWVTHTYDALARRVAVEEPAGEGSSAPTIRRWRHDGLSVTETDPLGRSTTRRFDVLGNVLQVIDPGLVPADYEYDAFDNLVKLRDGQGAETSLAYDVRGFRRSLVDPDLGASSYDYFPLGELRSRTNARGQVTTFVYDRLSRPVTRKDPEGTTTWTWGTSAASRNIGSLARVTSPGFRETYQYDALGRPGTVTTTAVSTSFVTRQSYDAATGAADILTYPGSTGTTPLRVRHHYDRGRLVRLSDADSGSTYWQLNAVNSRGLATDESLGNGVRTLSHYDTITGRLLGRTSGPGGGSAHQNLAYAWDPTGNLVRREERTLGVDEQFTYDDRDRLDHVQRAGVPVLDLEYDAVGNLTYKSDVGDYRYDPLRRHAVVAAGDNVYKYDANGAVVNASGTSITWFSYDLPRKLTHPGGNYSTFYYGPDRQRFRQTAGAGGIVTDTLYAAGGLYERVTSGQVVSHRHYIVADGRRVAVQTRRSGTTPSTVYLLEDHLGGVDGLTSESGALLARTSYQPFGARRSGNWLGATPTASEWQQIQASTPRGFSDHEHLDNIGLVHMNGRVYDPVLGRFLSPDPVVQDPYDSQLLNRYSYVRNNPLRYTDPSGLCTYTHATTDHFSTPCLPLVLVEASRLQERQTFGPGGHVDRSILFGAVTEGGGSGVSGSIAGPVEEVVVAGTRLPDSPAPATEVGDMAAGGDVPLSPWTDAVRSLVQWQYFDEVVTIGSVALALLEPTPFGEMVVGAGMMGASRALVPYYPSANGFIGATNSQTLLRGQLIDRYGGSSFSRFFSPVGTSARARSLPPGTAGQPLRTFQVMESLTVESGRVAPWFTQPGLGIQYRTPATLGEMLEQGILREVRP